jgi:threonylcarbamoyladenosine tRNA methylthiotransferase MtaB
MKKVALYTLGCRVNKYETEAITEAFLKHGYTVVDFDSFADVYIINTCTVTNMSDKKSRQMIRRVKKINPEAVVAAVGCYAQVAPDEVSKIHGVDIIVGTKDKDKLAKIVDDFLVDKKQIIHVDDILNLREFEEIEIDEYQDKTRAFLKIQDGCDRYCSYCLIPYARGPVRSREPKNIINEVRKLSTNGFKEIILSGIHVASYGKDLKNISLIDIIEQINSINGIERIRIGSVEPMFFNADVIERLSKINKFCPHFHLSLQSGCDKTLERMNRKYTTEEYFNTVKAIRQHFLEASITTDIIVGFPGETDEEYNATYEFLKKIRLSKMHVFKFSPRKGTKAETFENQIRPEIKEARSNLLLKLDSEYEKAYISKYIGTEMKVLFEHSIGVIFNGYTTNYVKVAVKSDVDISGTFQNVRLTDVENDHANGMIVTK